MRICILYALQPCSRGRAVVFGGTGVMGLLVEVFTSFLNGAVFVSQDAAWPGLCEQLTSGVSISMTDHPIPNSHATLQHLPFPLSSLLPLLWTWLLTSQDCGHTYAPPLPHALLLEIRAAFFQLLLDSISLPQYSLSILKWQWGSKHFSLYPLDEESSVLKYFPSLVTEAAVGFHPENKKDNYT